MNRRKPFRNRLSSSRLFTAWMVLIMAFAMLPALPSAPVAEAGTEDPTPTPTATSSQPDGEDEEDEEGEADPQADQSNGETDSQAEQPNGQTLNGTATYAVEKRLCPPGYDLATVTASTALTDCADPLPNIQFALSLAETGDPGQIEETNASGEASWDIPYGSAYRVEEGIPAGYGEGSIYCAYYLDPNAYDPAHFEPNGANGQTQSGSQPDATSYFPALGGVMNVGVGDPSQTEYRLVRCVWFNVLLEGEQGANGEEAPNGEQAFNGEEEMDGEAQQRITINKYVCLPEYDYTLATLQDLLDNCDDPHGNVAFYIPLDGQMAAQATNSDGLVQFYNIPSGTLEIREAVLPGYQAVRVVCHAYPYGTVNSNEELYEDVTVTTSPGYHTIEYQLDEGYELHCYWFNAAVEDDGDYAWVYAYKYVCPPGYDYETASRDELWQNCTETLGGVDYTLENENGSYQSTQTTGEDGRASWEQVPPTEPGNGLMLIERVPAGYSLVKIYCGGLTENAGTLPPAWTEVQDEENLLILVAAGYYVHCEFYNIPVEDGEVGRVYLYKHVCPVGYEYEGASREALEADCADPLSGVEFQVNHASGSYSESGTSDSDGQATFEGVPSGPVILGETPQEGYSLAAVYCGVTAINNGALPETWEQAEYDDGLPYELPAGSYLHCVFYNVPVEDEYGTVYAYKYVCPPDYDDEGASREDLESNCTEPFEGLQYSAVAQSGEYLQEQTTNEDGRATWQQVPAGGVVLTESPPPGYTFVGAYCGVALQNNLTLPETWEEVENPDGVFYELPAGQYLHCVFYNAPIPDYSTVTITKYVCPQGLAFAVAPDRDDYAIACQDVAGGVDYQLASDGGPLGSGSTNAGGQATIGTDYVGDVALSEEENEAYLPIALYCTGGDFGEDYQQVTLNNGSSSPFPLAAESQITCEWYNEAQYDTGQVLVWKYVCLPDLDHEGASREDFEANCADPYEGATFTVGAAEGGYQEDQTSDENGLATWEQVPAGSVEIFEEPVPGYQLVAVYCGVIAQNALTLPEIWEQMAYQDGFSYELPPGQYLHCVFYNVPADEYGWVDVYKYICPPGYDYEGATSRDDLWENCTGVGVGVDYAISGPEGYEDSGSTDEEGYVWWEQVPAGSISLTETPPPGYQPVRIYCGEVLVNGNGAFPEQWEDFTNGPGISFDLVAGYRAVCEWYNAAEGYEADTIVITKYECPNGYGSVGASYEDYETYCHQVRTDYGFRITQNGTEVGTITTGEDGTGSYTGVPAGQTSITELPKEGYDQPRVFCRAYHWEGGPSGEYEEHPVENWGIGYDFPGGYVLECKWYNQPRANEYDTPGRILLHKYYCDEGYEPAGKSYGDYEADCTQPHEGVTYTLSNGGGSEPELSTSASGQVEWTDLAPGGWTITESPPPGYKTLAVYCDAYPSEGTPQTSYLKVDVQGSAFNYHLAAGYTLECYWYNAPFDEYGTIHLYKYDCPEGYDHAGASREDLFNDCGTPHGDVSYSLSGPGGYQEGGTTDSDGSAAWSEVPPGSVTIAESPPIGYLPARVYCGQSQTNQGTLPSDWQEYSLDAGWSISYPVQAGYYLTCYWFNIPYDEEPPRVWLQKYHCPEGVDQTWTYHQFLLECTDPGAGVEYGVGYPGQPPSSVNTSQTGRASLGELEPGTLLVTELLPTGYAGVVVYCQYVTPHHAGNYLRAPTYHGTMSLHLDYGYVVTCYWFNIPPGYEPDEPTPTSDYPDPVEPDVPNPSGTSGPPLGPTGTGTGTGTGTDPAQGTGPATLIITKYTCPDGYDLHGPEADVVNECGDVTEGIAYELTDGDGFSEPATTDSDGEATWSGLEPGPYVLQETLPEGTQSAFIWTCQSDYREFQAEYPFTPFSYAGPDGRIGVTLVPGEVLACDWYDVPAREPQGEVTVRKYACPGTTVIPSQCDLYLDGATIGLNPVDGLGGLLQLTTGSDGSATATAEGIYMVTEAGAAPCLIDSEAFNEDGYLVIGAGDAVEVRIYNCGVTADAQTEQEETDQENQ